MHQIEFSQDELVNITPAMKQLLNDARSKLKGTDRSDRYALRLSVYL